MKTMFQKRQRAPVVVLSMLAALVLSSAVHAKSSFLTSFNSMYSSSTSGDNSGCQLCHAASTQNLNSYGKSICDQGGSTTTSRLQVIENENSDVDPTGSSNIEEINASAQPGWTLGNVNPTYRRGDCSPTGLTEAPPTFIPGDLDPVLAGNTPPVAANDAASTALNTMLTIDVLANDNDADGDALAVASVSMDGSTSGNVSNNTVDVTYTPDTNFCGTASFQYQATDGIDSSNTAIVTVTVGDTNAPIVTVPMPDLTIMLPPGSTGLPVSDQQIADWLAMVTATDTEEGGVPVSDNAPANFEVGTTPVVFTASDACGNTGTATANVIVQVADNNVPVVMAPTPDPLVLTTPLCAVSLPRTDADISNWLASAIATDAEDGDLNVSNNAPSHFPIGDTPVTFSATDNLGATGSVDATVTVNATPNAAPTVSAPAPISITVPSGTTTVPGGTDSAIQAFLAAAGAADAEDGDLAVTDDALVEFPLGTTTVTFTATDSCGLSGTAQSAVTIIEDQPVNNDPPQLSAPAPITVEVALCGTSVPATDLVSEAFLGGATATDAEDGDLTAQITNDAPADFLAAVAPGVATTVTFSVTDSGDPTGTPMTSTTTSTVTAVDPNTAPLVSAPAALSITVPAGTSSVPASDPAIAAFLVSVMAQDKQDGMLSVSNDAPTDFGPGTTTVVFSATDACGLTATASSTLTIQEESSADVFLTRLMIRKGDISLRVGNTTSRRVQVKGDADSMAQDATVTLSVAIPPNVSVVVTPESITREVSPDGGATRFSFDVDISCDGSGSGTVDWTAVIGALQNSDATNDILTSTTSVRCEGRRGRGR
jgi:hypothetical protein